MKQPIANIVLKMDRNGSTTQQKNVTPAEVMLLCAMHLKNAGQDPILKLEVIEEGSSDKEMALIESAIEKLESDLARLEENETMLEDVRQSKVESIQKRIEVKQSTLQGLKQINAIRDLDPSDEYRRLGFKYSAITLKEFYPGRVPNLPNSFEEARKNGTSTSIVEAKWIVGDNKFANG